MEQEPDIADINASFKKAADNELREILEYSEAPLVSSDVVGNTHSAIFDSQLTDTKNNMIKVVSWYDNEAGYAARLGELAVRVAHLS